MRFDSIRTTAALALLVALSPVALEAQIFKAPQRTGTPRAWVSGSYAWARPGTYADGATGTEWSFGDAFVPSATIELPLGRSGTTLGVSASQGEYTLRYAGGALVSACASGCDAQGRVRTAAVMLRAGGGAGLHQVLELSGGVTQYDRLRRENSDTPLAPERRRNGTLTVGYGLGFPLTQRLQLALVQDLGLVFRSREGLPSNASRTVQNSTTRLSVRFGFGNR